MRLLNGSSAVSFLASFAVALYNAFIAESRVILTNMILLTSLFVSLLMALLGNTTIGIKKLIYLSISGIFACLCIGTKFTGLVVLPLIFLILIKPFYYQKPFKVFFIIFRDFLIFLLMTSSIYILGWYLHFSLLQKPGTEDVFYKNSGNSIKDTIILHEKMLFHNINLKTPHNYSSKWWQWPLARKPVYYWAGKEKSIYLVGNSIVWWGASFFFIVACGI